MPSLFFCYIRYFLLETFLLNGPKNIFSFNEFKILDSSVQSIMQTPLKIFLIFIQHACFTQILLCARRPQTIFFPLLHFIVHVDMVSDMGNRFYLPGF